MSTTLFRVVNQGLVKNSLLIDKVDLSQGNSFGSSRKAKQKVYVPLLNPNDKSVRGYIDMVPTDEVLLSMNGKGTLAQLQAHGYVSVTAFASALTATPTVSAAVHTGGGSVHTVITGTTMASFAPDVTYVTFTNLAGLSQTVTDQAIIAATGGAFSTTSITVPDSMLTIGTPTTGWKVQVQANSKKSNVQTL